MVNDLGWPISLNEIIAHKDEVDGDGNKNAYWYRFSYYLTSPAYGDCRYIFTSEAVRNIHRDLSEETITTLQNEFDAYSPCLSFWKNRRTPANNDASKYEYHDSSNATISIPVYEGKTYAIEWIDGYNKGNGDYWNGTLINLDPTWNLIDSMYNVYDSVGNRVRLYYSDNNSKYSIDDSILSTFNCNETGTYTIEMQANSGSNFGCAIHLFQVN